MKRLILVLAITVVAVFAVSGSPRQASAGPALPPLLNCPDVTGDGPVDFFDFLALLQNYGTEYPDADFYYLYDWAPNGAVDFFDFLVLLQNYNQTCPLMESQVTLATLAAMKYRDPAQAFADGYTWGSQYVPQMGVHLINATFQNQYPNFYDPVNGEDQLRHPVGLVYSETSPGSNQPDELIGVWYVLPVQAVCDFYAIAEPCQSNTVSPVGFGETNTDEDNQDPPGPEQGWHTHSGLCVAGWGTIDAEVWELGPGSQNSCLNPPRNGDAWFSTYGWMMHLYNFIPNPEGRFMLWNTNPNFP